MDNDSFDFMLAALFVSATVHGAHGAAYAREAGADGRRLRRRRPDRHRGEAVRRASCARASASRSSSTTSRAPTSMLAADGGGARQARRPHAAHGGHQSRDDPGAVPKGQVRRREGLRGRCARWPRARTVLVVGPSMPVNSVKELLERLRAKPGELTYVTPGGRQFAAPCDGDVSQAHRHGHGPRPVQGCRACRDRICSAARSDLSFATVGVGAAAPEVGQAH